MQEIDPDLNFILDLKLSASAKLSWSDTAGKNPEIKYGIARCQLLSVCSGLLCIEWEHSETNKRWKICIPTSRANTVLWYVHDAHVPGHLGIRKNQ